MDLPACSATWGALWHGTAAGRPHPPAKQDHMGLRCSCPPPCGTHAQQLLSGPEKMPDPRLPSYATTCTLNAALLQLR
jgi:hypothetical protein